jgi:glycyl-tRNA synthetase beta chain
VGADYARKQGEDPVVCGAVDDHYRPRFAGDVLPRHVVGAVVALADKIDTVVGGFAAGLQPSGSQDPFALRRNALGVLRTLAEFPFPQPIGVRTVVASALAGYARGDAVELEARVVEFLRGRLQAMYGATYPTDLVDAVLEAGFDDVPSVNARLAALDTIRASAKDFEPLAVAFKRVANIVRKAGDEATNARVDSALLAEAAERTLYGAVQGAASVVPICIAKGEWVRALGAISQVRPQVDAFFDTVLVMDDDLAIRRNRLALLKECEGLFHRIADFGRLQG